VCFIGFYPGSRKANHVYRAKLDAFGYVNSQKSQDLPDWVLNTKKSQLMPSADFAFAHATPGFPLLRATAAFKSRRSSNSSTRDESRDTA
jgi:hypothetical protein